MLRLMMFGAATVAALAISHVGARTGVAGQNGAEHARPHQSTAGLQTVPSIAPGKFLGFELLELDGSQVRWRSNGADPVTVSYAFLTRPSKFTGARNCTGMVPADQLLRASNISAAAWRKEAAAAFRMWETVADIRFKEISDADAADILIGAQDQPLGRAFADVAYVPARSRVRDIKRSLICLNPKQPWKIGFDGNKNVYDVRYTLAHEIGHAIGLDHAGRSGQLMSFRYEERFRDLQAGDVAGAMTLYGAPRLGRP